MFVIVHNNQVILGPMPWRKFFFENIIEEDCEVQVTLPQKNDGVYVVNNEISILPARYTHEEHNPITQKHNGPFWTFTDTEAIGNFVTLDKDVDHVKSELKDLAVGLNQTVDYGWLWPIAKLLFLGLQFFHNLVGKIGRAHV